MTDLGFWQSTIVIGFIVIYLVASIYIGLRVAIVLSNWTNKQLDKFFEKYNE